MADLFLQVNINGDVALLKGIMKAVVAEENRLPRRVLNHRFIARYTSGLDEFLAALNQITWSEIVEHSGVPQDQLEEAAKIFIESERTIFCWAMGLTQHRNAVANIQEIVNLMLLRGQIGIPGAGLCPVRGHSNVQGDRTMGIWEVPQPLSWINWQRNSILNRRAITASTPLMRFVQCTSAKERCSSRLVVIFFQQLPTRNTPQRLCGVAV